MKIGKKGAVGKELTRAEKNRRNNLRRTTVSLAVAFVLFIALTVIQSSILNQEKKDKVYQVIQNIDVGTRITEDNFDNYFKLKEVQLSLIPEGYILNKEDIINQYVTRAYKINDIITKDGVRDIESEYKDDIKNPIEVSFDISNLGSGVAGTLREGDLINIYGIARGTGEDAGKYVLNSDYSFERVYIAAAFDGSGNKITSLDISDSNTVTMLTLIISEDDAAKFTEMLNNCQIHIAKIIYNLDNVNLNTGNGEVSTIEKEDNTNKQEETTQKQEETTTQKQEETTEKETDTVVNEEETTSDRDITIPTGDNGNSSDLDNIFN